MAISPARTAAFEILRRVETESSYASELLHSPLLHGLMVEDRALATELVMGVLRWQVALDSRIARAVDRPLARLDNEVLIAIRIALYQLCALSRIPAHAAVHESVELVRRARKRSAIPFTNAILRKLVPLAATLWPAGALEVSAEGLGDAYSHPAWLIRRWISAYGWEAAREICEYDQSIPSAIVRMPPGADELELRRHGLEVEPGKIMARARRVVVGEPSRLPWGSSGIFLQDEASQLVAALVGQGRSILDCCAAPGGKTAAIAERNPGASIVATDLHPHRARLLSRLTSSPSIAVLAADATALPFAGHFDRVLADLPCSGTRTLARHPEIKLRLKPSDIEDLAARQRRILAAAAAQVAPAGRLVFSTCSLETDENEALLEEILSRKGEKEDEFALLDCRDELLRLRREGELIWDDLDSLLRGRCLRTIPGIHPCDGFFAAILQRR